MSVAGEGGEATRRISLPAQRVGLWKSGTWPDPATVPTLRAMISKQKNLPAPAPEEDNRSEAYRSELY